MRGEERRDGHQIKEPQQKTEVKREGGWRQNTDQYASISQTVASGAETSYGQTFRNVFDDRRRVLYTVVMAMAAGRSAGAD